MSKNNYVLENKKNPFFTILKIIVVIIVFIIMIGLENSVNVNNLCFANIIGLDKSENIPSNLLVTFQFITPKLESSNSVSTDETLITSIDANSLDMAAHTTQDYISSNIDFSNADALIISEDLAKDGVQRYISNISSNLRYNTNMYIIICEGKAQDFIETLDKNKDISPLTYFNILENSEEYTGSTKVVNITEFSDLLFTTYAYASTPICKINTNEDSKKEDKEDKKESSSQSSNKSNSESSSNNSSDSSTSSEKSETIDNTNSKNTNTINQKSNINIEVGGTALFKDEKLIGSLTSDETAFHIMLTSRLKSYTTTLDFEKDDANNNQNSSANVSITQTAKASIKVDTKGSKPRIDIKVPLNIIVLDTPAGEYDYLDSNYINNVKNNIKEILDKKMEAYFYKLQKEYNVDLDEFYKYSRKNFLTVNEYNEYNFKEKFKDAKINVKFDINFNDSGLNIEK